MRFNMTVPCNNCPFRRACGVPLSAARIREIGGMMLESQGGVFPCHKSVDYSDWDDDGNSRANDGQVHCAGALIWAEKHQKATQMMRICERLGLYDHTKLADAGLVWDSLRDWLKHALR